MFSRIWTTKSTEIYSDKISRLKTALIEADAVLIGAGAGLSASAGLTYSGERFEKYFKDFADRYGIPDMYSGGFIHSRRWRNIGRGGAAISGGYAAADRYDDFVRRHDNLRILYLELGVGSNTPVLRSLSTRNKSRKNTVKQQISDVLHDKSKEYTERRCA